MMTPWRYVFLVLGIMVCLDSALMVYVFQVLADKHALHTQRRTRRLRSRNSLVQYKKPVHWTKATIRDPRTR